MSRARTLIVGIVLTASLAANVLLIRTHGQDTRAIAALQGTDSAAREEGDIAAQANRVPTVPYNDSAAADERDILMELIPAITTDVRLEDIEAYLGTVYSGEPVGVTEDPKCIGCVVVSWRSFRFAFDEMGRLSKVSRT